MRNVSTTIIVLLVFSLLGCNYRRDTFVVDISPEANPWTHLRASDPDNFQFAIVSDRTGGIRPGVFSSAVDKVNRLQPEFVMCVGDLIKGYTDDETVLDQQWDEFDGIVDRLDMPFFYVRGNHDNSNETMAKKWTQRLGRPYYHFVYNNVLFLCLDTQEPSSENQTGWIGDRQVDYFAKAIKDNAAVSWTFVFMHQPLWEESYKDTAGWKEIEELLRGRQYTVFAGHHHTYKKMIRHGQSYYELATTGGASDLAGPSSGHFDHIVWVSMTEDGPHVVNLTLEGILDQSY